MCPRVGWRWRSRKGRRSRSGRHTRLGFRRPNFLGDSVDFDLGVDLFGNRVRRSAAGILAQRFGFPPFSVLDGRSGAWVERKRLWLSLGIRSEIGRSATSYNTEDTLDGCETTGTSVFDPVICEMVYRWFCGSGGQVVDPFAGGSVRGIVAAAMGLRYWGCDLRLEQIEANRKQSSELAGLSPGPEWVVGDCRGVLQDSPPADLLFSCPPYGDLERYSDDPRDLSTMEWHTFCAEYRRCLLAAVRSLKNNRFAVFVVGDFRDGAGFHRGFVADTIAAFYDVGLRLYNEAILVSPVGTGAARASRQFLASRKLVRLHQHVLVFCKGDPREAARRCAPIDGSDDAGA